MMIRGAGNGLGVDLEDGYCGDVKSTILVLLSTQISTLDGGFVLYPYPGLWLYDMGLGGRDGSLWVG